MLLALGAPGAHANPDVWVKAGMTYRFEDAKVTGITFDWRFDEYFSSRTITTYDANQSGILEAKEVDHLRGEAFDPLEKFGYYVHIRVAGKKRENLKIEDFAASIDGNQLVYRFTVALTPPADPGAGDIVASLHDYAVVHEFVADVIAQGVEASVSATVIETVETVTTLYKENKKLVTNKQFGSVLGVDTSTAWRRAKAAIDGGWLENEETRPNRTWRLKPGEPLPEEEPVLPAPESIACLRAFPEGEQEHMEMASAST